MSEPSRAELEADLQDLDARIAELKQTASDLSEQVGGQGDGAQDAEDVAAALTNVEETEAVLATLEQRRETLATKLAAHG